MNILRREWYDVSRADTFRIVPLGDVHLGNAACDEKLFKSAIADIAADDNAYWIGMGDFAEFINRRDPRFSVTALADWVTVADLVDLASAQAQRFLEFVEPIAHKCLALVEGNHERSITKHYERDIYREIAHGIKQAAGWPADHHLCVGVYGWLMLHFYRASTKQRGRVVKLNLHHGFVGGKLAGAKALNMQRWLWSHDADLVLFGHSHNSSTQVEAVEQVRGNRIEHVHRIGAYGGTFMNGAEYAQAKGYFPIPKTYTEIVLRPHADAVRDRIKVISSM